VLRASPDAPISHCRTATNGDCNLKTLLVLGPAQALWSDEFNKARLATIMPLIRKACDDLWGGIPAENRDLVWSMTA